MINSNIYKEDLCLVAQTMETTSLKGKKVLIAGAGGLIGSAIVDLLLHIGGITVIAAGRNRQKLYSLFGNSVKYVQYDAIEPIEFAEVVDVIIYVAGPSTPDMYVNAPVETMLSNIIGINNLLEYSRKWNVKKVVYVSSSEVYGKAAPREDGYIESDSGFVDALKARSSYPMGKRASETLCACYVKEYNVNVSIVRPGHIYGPTASLMDTRVVSAFARSAAYGEDIVLRSTGCSLRSYTHCLDCASAIITVSTKGISGEAYNIANRYGVCTIRDMASVMAKMGGVKVFQEKPCNNEQACFNPMENSCLNPVKLEGLGWKGVFGYEQGFSRLVSCMKELLISSKS